MLPSDVDLAAGILAKAEQRERERAAGNHVELADLLEVVAVGVGDEQPPVVVRPRGNLKSSAKSPKTYFRGGAEQRAVIDEAADDRVPFVVGVVLRDGVDELRRDRAGGIRRRTGEALDVAVDVEEERPLLDVPAVVAALDDAVHFLDVVLADVADEEFGRFGVSNENLKGFRKPYAQISGRAPRS